MEEDLPGAHISAGQQGPPRGRGREGRRRYSVQFRRGGGKEEKEEEEGKPQIRLLLLPTGKKFLFFLLLRSHFSLVGTRQARHQGRPTDSAGR